MSPTKKRTDARLSDSGTASGDGLSDVDSQEFEAFEAAMEAAIPDIVRDEEERQELAADSRRWPLKS